MGQLKQAMTQLDVAALGLSASIGVSIFAVVTPTFVVAGPAVLLSLLIAAVPMLIFVVVYAFMGSAIPRSGSSYAWPAQFIHPYVAFSIAWLRLLSTASGLHLLGVVFHNYLSELVVLPKIPVILGLLTTFSVIQLLGVGLVGAAARVLVATKILVLAAFIVIGIPHVRADAFAPFMPHGLTGVLVAVPLLVGLYGGIESAAEAGEEIRNGRRALGRGVALSSAISILAYGGVFVVAIGVLGARGVSNSGAPISDAAATFLGPATAPVVTIMALIAISAALNAFLLVMARVVFAMGRDGVLPSALAKIHPRFGTPHVALAAVLALGVAGLFLPGNMVFLFLALNLPTMLKYGANCLSASRLVRFHPQIHAQALWKLSRKTVLTWSYLGVVCALGFFLIGLSADWRPYTALVAWLVLGTLYWHVYGKKGRSTASGVTETTGERIPTPS